MDFDQTNEEHLRYLEEYIKRFHLYNGIEDSEAEMLGKLNSYWHRRNVASKSKRRVDCLQLALKNLIDDYKTKSETNNYEILDVLYLQIEDIISTIEEQRTREGLVRYYLSFKNNNLIVRVIRK